MKRPLKNKRPIGPFFSTDEEYSQSEVAEENATTSEAQHDDPVLQQAEDWWQGINDERNKRKMMTNYLKSVTDLPDSEVEDMIDEAGL